MIGEEIQASQSVEQNDNGGSQTFSSTDTALWRFCYVLSVNSGSVVAPAKRADAEAKRPFKLHHIIVFNPFFHLF